MVKGVRSPAQKMQAIIDNQALDIKNLEMKLAEEKRKAKAIVARNEELVEIVGKYASALVDSEKKILELQRQLQK